MNKRGFTLIEMLVVIGIILVLAGIAIPVYFTAIGKAHEATCISNLRQLSNAIAMYKQDAKQFPAQESPMSVLVAAGLLDKQLTCPDDRDRTGDSYGPLYNYWGYEMNRRPVPIRDFARAGAVYGPLGEPYWITAGESKPDTSFPGLINVAAPSNVIVTMCPNHITKKGGYNVLRVGGEIAWVKAASDDQWALSK